MKADDDLELSEAAHINKQSTKKKKRSNKIVSVEEREGPEDSQKAIMIRNYDGDELQKVESYDDLQTKPAETNSSMQAHKDEHLNSDSQ